MRRLLLRWPYCSRYKFYKNWSYGLSVAVFILMVIYVGHMVVHTLDAFRCKKISYSWSYHIVGHTFGYIMMVI